MSYESWVGITGNRAFAGTVLSWKMRNCMETNSGKLTPFDCNLRSEKGIAIGCPGNQDRVSELMSILLDIKGHFLPFINFRWEQTILLSPARTAIELVVFYFPPIEQKILGNMNRLVQVNADLSSRIHHLNTGSCSSSNTFFNLDENTVIEIFCYQAASFENIMEVGVLFTPPFLS